MSGLQAKLAELSKENHVLKRAVAIQQSRWQEAVSANKQQALQAEGIITQLQVGPAWLWHRGACCRSLRVCLRVCALGLRPD